jgi:hypothetical protein
VRSLEGRELKFVWRAISANIISAFILCGVLRQEWQRPAAL